MVCSSGSQKMFCYQCEQTAKGTGCTIQGVCGKSSEVATLQDLLIYLLKILSTLAIDARKKNISTDDINLFVCEALFATVTNVDFDEDCIVELIKKADKLQQDLFIKLKLERVDPSKLMEAYPFKLSNTKEKMIPQGMAYRVLNATENIDVQSLKNTLLFGIKGIAAYADHAAILGQKDTNICHFLQKALAAMLRNNLTLEEGIALVMECGQINLRTMELLDKANTDHYGHPIPTEVPLGVKQGKAILVSGHDLRDLELLLKQTEGKSINIYPSKIKKIKKYRQI